MVLQAEPMKLNYKQTQTIHAIDKYINCSVVKLSDTGDGTEVIGKLIPLGGTSTLHQTSYSVMRAKYLKRILNCFKEPSARDDNVASIGTMFQQLLGLLDDKVEAYRGDGNKYTETAKQLLHMFMSVNFITLAQLNTEKAKLSSKGLPWLHLYRVVRLLNVAVIFNNDTIVAIYQHIISVAKLQFNIEDIPALKATVDSNVSDYQDFSTEKLNIQVFDINSNKDYLNIVKQANVKKEEKCTILYGVRE